MKESKAMMRKEVAFMKKKGAPESMIKHEEKEMRGMKKGVKKMFGGGTSYVRRSGPISREATGPTSPRATYVPNPFGKSIKVPLGPTGGSQPRVPSRNPRDIFGNENPNFSQDLREAEETRALEEMRMNREPVKNAKGGKIRSGMKHKAPKKHRYAGGGVAYSSGGSVYRRGADGIASKGKTKGKMVKMRMGGEC